MTSKAPQWMTLLVLFLTFAKEAFAFVRIVGCCPPRFAALRGHRSQSTICTTPENDVVLAELSEEIESVAKELWDGAEIPRRFPHTTDETGAPTVSVLLEGEAGFLENNTAFSDRGDRFRREALAGCPRAQHSYGLLLWSGFGGIEPDPEESAKFHAAAACQHHLDGMAVFGGCLRTGAGLPKKQPKAKAEKKKKKGPKASRRTNTVALGLKLIDYCAAVGNPTGVNKKAALLESNGNDSQAVELYEACYKSGRANALLLFNLGWCLLNGWGVDRTDRARGISLWKEATELAPDEGSEEAAWNLYQEYLRSDDPEEARHWLELAEELGYRE